MSGAPQYTAYIRAFTRNFDDPVTGGAVHMGEHQLAALREVHPALYHRMVASSGLWPFADTWAHPELEEWIGEHWHDAV